MKKQIGNLALKAISKVALQSAKTSANSACMFFAYQPKEPQQIKKLRKF